MCWLHDHASAGIHSIFFFQLLCGADVSLRCLYTRTIAYLPTAFANGDIEENTNRRGIFAENSRLLLLLRPPLTAYKINSIR